MLPLLIMLADVDALMAASRRLTATEGRCHLAVETDITVCARRAADRFRVPFEGYETGDRRAEGVSAERQRLLNVRNACQEMKAIMTGCGFVGARIGTDGRGGPLRPRTMAP